MSKPLLQIIDQRLCLVFDDEPMNPIYVDFLEGANAHRRLFGGGKNQLLSKAVGANKHKGLTVLDATAGLGRDAFVLACLGCQVTLCERSETIAALLKDGLQRAAKEDWFAELSLHLIEGDAITYLQKTDKTFDVIYVDPMHPPRNKSALVKKDMRALRDVVGDDQDSEHLLQIALQAAKKRVVVKRPRLADPIVGASVDLTFAGKSTRFDVYLNLKTPR